MATSNRISPSRRIRPGPWRRSPPSTAEHTTVDLQLVRDLLRPELNHEADTFTAETVRAWPDVDWDNFTAEYPGVEGTAAQWQLRLALALDRAWASPTATG